MGEVVRLFQKEPVSSNEREPLDERAYLESMEQTLLGLLEDWQVRDDSWLTRDKYDAGEHTGEHRENKLRSTWFSIVYGHIQKLLPHLPEPHRTELHKEYTDAKAQFDFGMKEATKAYQEIVAPKIQSFFAARGIDFSLEQCLAASFFLLKDTTGGEASRQLVSELEPNTDGSIPVFVEKKEFASGHSIERKVSPALAEAFAECWVAEDIEADTRLIANSPVTAKRTDALIKKAITIIESVLREPVPPATALPEGYAA